MNMDFTVEDKSWVRLQRRILADKVAQGREQIARLEEQLALDLVESEVMADALEEIERLEKRI